MSDNKLKNHIYLMPGLAANSRIFENIKTENLSEYELMTIFQENKELINHGGEPLKEE